jgi:Cu-Zn family superoxide dismutase
MRKLFVFASFLLIVSCAHSKGPMAMATLDPTSGSTAKGVVHFTDVGDGNVEVVVDLTGVPPGVHGFHIHEKGDCGNNAMNAGGHFNPTGMIHGAPDAVSHHAGDFGNVTAEANGEVHTRFTTHSISLKANDTTNAVGHAVVLHANPDDLTSQPAGNAGPRIACGIVQIMTGM